MFITKDTLGMKDEICVWLTLHSGSGHSGSEIGNIVGLQSNASAINSLGRTRPDKCLILQSNIDIPLTAPLAAHLNWILSKCLPHRGALASYIAVPENRGEIFILGQTDKGGIYFEFSNKDLLALLELGFDFEIKAEMEY